MEIKLIFNNNNLINCKLEFKIKNNNLNLIFSDLNNNNLLISDDFSSFKIIQFDEINSLKCIFKNEIIERIIYFLNENDLTIFWEKIEKFCDAILLPGKEKIFNLIHKNKKNYFKIPNKVTGFVEKSFNSFLNYSKNKNNNKNFEEKIIDGIENNIILIDYPENYNFDENINLINLIENNFFNFENFDYLNNYLKIENQWKNITLTQWNHSYKIRKFIFDFEQYIIKSKFLNFKKIIFNILISLYFYKFQTFNFQEILIEYLGYFIEIYLFKELDNEIYLTNNQEKLNFNSFCSKIFWIFKTFYNKFFDQKSNEYLLKNFNKNFNNQLMEKLLKLSPSTYEILIEKNINFLNYEIINLPLLFLMKKSLNYLLFFIKFLINLNPINFLIDILIISLIFLQNRLNFKNDFFNLFENLIIEIDLNLLLLNIEKIK